MMNFGTRRTAGDAILQELGNQQRRVLSQWRAFILLRRATLVIPRPNRRWDRLPKTREDMRPLLRSMQARGELVPIPRFPSLYEITIPFAQTGPLDEHEILLEANPFAVISHFSALVFHGLTDQQPTFMTATVPRSVSDDHLPIDTDPSDWEGLSLPSARRRPETVLRTPVRWTTVDSVRLYGFLEYQPHGTRIRVTTPERTLVDALQSPEISGGIANVLRAWAIGAPMVNLDSLTEQVERYDIQVLRQRAGFVLDRLGLQHRALDLWQQKAHRGGSSRLVGSKPFASSFDERWNLSINASTTTLEDGFQ